jgi:hypothetical protein
MKEGNDTQKTIVKAVDFRKIFKILYTWYESYTSVREELEGETCCTGTSTCTWYWYLRDPRESYREIPFCIRSVSRMLLFVLYVYALVPIGYSTTNVQSSKVDGCASTSHNEAMHSAYLKAERNVLKSIRWLSLNQYS